MLKRIGFLILSLLLMTGCTTETKKKSFNIVVTNFPCYDFVRAITKNDPDISIKMLIKPVYNTSRYAFLLTCSYGHHDCIISLCRCINHRFNQKRNIQGTKIRKAGIMD